MGSGHSMYLRIDARASGATRIASYFTFHRPSRPPTKRTYHSKTGYPQFKKRREL